ncbi:MAG: response regulator [Chitinophagaceae bacterium]
MKLIIADDHGVVRAGLELLAQDAVNSPCTIEQAVSGDQLLDKLQAAEYDTLITDMNMPGLNGLQLLEKVLQIQPTLHVLVVSVNSEDFFAARCFQLGALGFISKKSDDDELRRAIGTVAAGRRYISESQRNRIAKDFFKEEQESNPLQSLSSRELDVTLLLLKGRGILEVANELSISPSTASTFKGRIFKKLNVSSLLELNQLARHAGFIDDNSTQH